MAADEPLLNFLTSLSVCLWSSHAFAREAQSRRGKERDQMACYLRHGPGFNRSLLGWFSPVMCPLGRPTKQSGLPCNFSKLFA